MHERDALNPAHALFVVTPSPMIEWMRAFVAELKHPSKIQLVLSHELNPEPFYYYQNWGDNTYRGIERCQLRPMKSKCEDKEADLS